MISEAQLLFVRMRDALDAMLRETYNAEEALDIDLENAREVARFCIKDAAPFIDQNGRFREMDHSKAELPPNPKRLLCCQCGEVLKPYWNLYSVWTCQTATCSYRGILTTHGTEPK
jgi:hypothetical protein